MEGYEPEYRYVGDDPHSYYQMLKNCWIHKQGFILLEHDIFPWPGALALMEECSEIWCAHEYLYPPVIGQTVVGIGCMKFSTEAIMRSSDIFEQIETFDARGADLLDWRYLDSWIPANLGKALGMKGPHIHNPPVVHLKSGVTRIFQEPNN